MPSSGAQLVETLFLISLLLKTSWNRETRSKLLAVSLSYFYDVADTIHFWNFSAGFENRYFCSKQLISHM